MANRSLLTLIAGLLLAIVCLLAVAALFLLTTTATPAPTPTPRPPPTATATPLPTDTPPPTPTWVLIPTATPLPTPRLPVSATPDGPPRVGNVQVTGGPFYSYDRERRCPQNVLTARARVTDANGVAEVVVAYRLVDSLDDRQTEYSPVPMTYIGDDTYVQSFAPFPRTGYFDYAVLARDRQGEIGRSGFHLPVQITFCLPLTVPTLVVPTLRP